MDALHVGALVLIVALVLCVAHLTAALYRARAELRCALQNYEYAEADLRRLREQGPPKPGEMRIPRPRPTLRW